MSRNLPQTNRELWARYVRQTRLLENLRLRVPEPLYLAAAGPRRPQSAAPRRAGGARQASASKASRPSRQRRAPAQRNPIEFPALQKYLDQEQTVLQPRFAAELLPSRDLHLPELFFWAPPVETRPVIKPFVMPGYVRPPRQVALLDGPPKLQLPALDPSSLRTDALAPVLSGSALLAPAPAMPIRTRNGGAAQGTSADVLPGDPTAVLSLSGNPLPLREFLTLPPGNQVGEAAGNSGRAGPGGREGQNGAGDTGGDADRSQTGPGPGGGGAWFGTGGGSGRLRPPAAVEATRLAHPVDGIFDVIVQSSGLDGFPESAGVLSGKPVYSVFLAVGSAKDWILQYCIPASDAQQAEIDGPVVRVGAPGVLSAPFPRVTMRPLIYRRQGTYMMLHGFIDPNGRFQDLRVLGANDPQESALVVQVLEQWEFRPAARDGRPVRVEMLLAIPSE